MTEPAASRLRAALRRFRRRALLVRSWHFSAIAACAVVPTVAVAAMAGWTPDGLVMSAVILGVPVAAAAAAWARRPSLTSTASEVDARLHLHNRLATALQYATDDDPYAHLVVRDGIAAAEGASPAAAFPFSAPRPIAPLLAVAVASLLLVLAETGVSGIRLAGRTPSAGAAGVSAARAARGAEPAAGTSAADQPSVQSRQAMPPAVRPAADAQDPAEGSALGGAASGPLRGAGGGVPQQGETTPAPGGIARGSLSASSANERLLETATAPSTYQAAWDAAEAGMTRGRVPVRLRAYVRQYLSDIREPDGP